MTPLRRQTLATKIALWLLALLIASSSLIALLQQPSQAALPLYGQESTGYGDRRVARTNAYSVAFDTSGNFFMSIGVGNNSYIRKFTPDGIFIKDFNISDTTGDNTISYTGEYARLAVDNNNLLYAINPTHKVIHVFDANGVFQTSISNTTLVAATDIMFDHDDNYYLTDPARHRVQKYTHDGTLIYTIGGPTASAVDGQFNTPGEIAVDSQNNLIATDIKNNRIQMFDETGAFIRKFGQKNSGVTCPAQPSIGFMNGLTVDQQDNIYIAPHETFCSNFVHKFNNNGVYIETQTRPSRTFYMRANSANVIYNIEVNPTASSFAMVSTYTTGGTVIGDKIVGQANALLSPDAVTQDSLGNTYIVDVANGLIKKYDTSHNFILSFGGYGSGPGKFGRIGDIAFDQNDILYVIDESLKNVEKFDTNGTYIDQFGTVGSGDGQFNNSLYEISILPNGNVAIVDGFSAGSRIHIMTPTGGFVATIAKNSIESIAVKSTGEITVLAGGQFFSYQADGTPITTPYRGNMFQNTQTSTTFRSTGDLSYDRLDNLYASGDDSTYAALSAGSYSVARINLDEPSIAGYRTVIPVIDIYKSNPFFTVTNQLLMPDDKHNYVRVYDSIDILQTPSAPLNLTVISSQPGTIDATWQAPTIGAPIVAYRIEYKLHDTIQWFSAGPLISSTNITINGLTDGSYDVRVKAINEAGEGLSAQKLDTTTHATYAYKSLLTSPTDSNTQGIVFDRTGKRYESNANTDQIDVYKADGSYDYSFGSSGNGPGQFYTPRGLAISADDKLYVAEYYGNRVSVLTLDGTYLSSFGAYGTADGQFRYPTQVTIDKSGVAYVVDEYRSIQKFDENGTYLGRIATELTSPVSMLIDNDDNIYVSNPSYDENHGIIKYDKNGNYLLTIGSEGEADGQLYEVYGMVINPQGDLVVMDTYNYRLQIFSPTGEHLSTIGRGYGNEGDFLTVDDVYAIAQASNGDLYIANAWSPYTQVLSYLGDTATPPVTGSAPSTPNPLTTDTATPANITLNWAAPASGGSDPLTGYTLRYKLASASTWTSITLEPTTTSHTLTNLNPGEYNFTIAAVSAAGSSAPTAASATVAATNPLAPPTSPGSVTPGVPNTGFAALAQTFRSPTATLILLATITMALTTTLVWRRRKVTSRR